MPPRFRRFGRIFQDPSREVVEEIVRIEGPQLRAEFEIGPFVAEFELIRGHRRVVVVDDSAAGACDPIQESLICFALAYAALCKLPRRYRFTAPAEDERGNGASRQDRHWAVVADHLDDRGVDQTAGGGHGQQNSEFRATV